MKRIRIASALLVSVVVAGVVAVALSVSMTGAGSVGEIQPEWSVLEDCTPSMPGDSRGSVGSASFAAEVKPESRFIANSEAVLTDDVAGQFRGRVSDVSVGPMLATVSVAGPLQFLNVQKTMRPIWLNDANDFLGFKYGSGTGMVSSVYGIAVDPVDGGVLVGSFGTVDGVDRYRIIKFSASGEYVTEFGSQGSGNGQFGGEVTVAVSPVDQSVWVGDSQNRRIQKFVTADGGLTYSYSAKVGSAGSGNGQFGSGSPIPVTVDASGNVYAGDRGNARIQKFSSSAVYQAQASVTGSSVNPYGLTSNGTTIYASTGVSAGTAGQPGRIEMFDTSLTPVGSLTLPAPEGTSTGIGNIAIDSDGGIWAQWFLATYLVKYDPTTGDEVTRWQSLFPAPTLIQTNMAIASGTAGTYVLFRPGTTTRQQNPYQDNYVVGFDFAPVALSQAIQRYMEACDPALNGWTVDYQATSDPDVVFPGWSGNVWANLRELFALYEVELALDHETQTIIIRDIGSQTTTFRNMTPPVTTPSNLTGGRVVDFIYQQPRAGGGVVWDAAQENVTLSIASGARETRILNTDNYPAELAQPIATDVLPLQPGQYYVTDSTGAPVPAETWNASGAAINLAVGAAPGTISATIFGPSADPAGFTGPFSFATGNEPTDTPTLQIVGNGTFCDPKRFVRSGSQGNPYAPPFLDTIDRGLSRGHYPSLRDPGVSIRFDVPTTDLPPVGSACGYVFPFEESRYRITEIRWGNLRSTVTAERYVTADDYDSVWSAETADDYDTEWSGFSASDYQIQPLKHT